MIKSGIKYSTKELKIISKNYWFKSNVYDTFDEYIYWIFRKKENSEIIMTILIKALNDKIQNVKFK